MEVALFEINGRRTALKPTILGGLYYERQEHRGLPRGATGSLSPVVLALWQELAQSGHLRVLISPGRLYHVWHICLCQQCARVGGRTWDHSQAAWDSHLRFAPNETVFTFPTAVLQN